MKHIKRLFALFLIGIMVNPFQLAINLKPVAAASKSQDIPGITTTNIIDQCSIDGPESQSGHGFDQLMDGDDQTLWVANGGNWPAKLHVKVPTSNNQPIKQLVIKLEQNQPDRSVDLKIQHALNGVTSDLIDDATLKDQKFGKDITVDFKDGINASDFYITLSNPKNGDKTGEFWPAIAELKLYADRENKDEITDVAPNADIKGYGDAQKITDNDQSTLYMLANGGISTLPNKQASVEFDLDQPTNVIGFQTQFEHLNSDSNNFEFTYQISGKDASTQQWSTICKDVKAKRTSPDDIVTSPLADSVKLSAVRITITDIKSTGGDPWPAIAEFKIFGESSDSSANKEDKESIAWNKTIHTNSNQDQVKRINDGSLTNSWRSKNYPSYVDIDLGSNYDLSEVQIYAPSLGYQNYTIYTSTDGNNFTRYAQKSNQEVTPATGDRYKKSATARFVRVYVYYNSKKDGAVLNEVRVLGKEANTTSKLAPIPTVTDYKNTDYNQQTTAQDAIDAVKGIIDRRLGKKYEDWFTFAIANQANKYDYFDISSDNGKVKITGNSGVSLASGLNYYLKHEVKVNLSEVADQAKMPEKIVLPTQTIHQETRFPVRYAFNYTTMSYSMPYWGKKEWQKEIDWLALNGINLVLDVTGQEAVWYEFLHSAGFTDPQIKDFVSAPSYAAWQYMSNLSGFGGPLNNEFFTNRVQLARENHYQMRKLGMEVCLQGYAGMIPDGITAIDSKVQLLPQGTWSGFQRPAMIKTDTPEFDKYAQLYYQAQAKVYGTYDHHYAIDPFHEGGNPGNLSPTVISQQVLKNMMQFDSKAVWVIQSWQGNPTTALLKGLGDNRDKHALVLDLNSETNPHWNETDPAKYGGSAEGGEFMKTPWAFSIIENFGGRDGMSGHIDSILSGLNDAMGRAKHMAGIGMTPEANQTNPVIFDLLFESIWSKDGNHVDQIDINKWIKDYAERRYGAKSDSADAAWKILLNTAYAAKNNKIGQGAPESVINARPATDISAASTWGNAVIQYDKSEFEQAARLLLKDYSKLKNSPGYQDDLATVLTQVLSNYAQEVQKQMTAALKNKDVAGFKSASEQFLKTIDQVDQVTGTQAESILGNWTQPAERAAAGLDDFSKDTALYNAKALITTWGSINQANAGGLKDYSNRQWSGLTKDFYKMRWQKWINAKTQELQTGQPQDISDADWFGIEWDWVHNGKNYPEEVNNADLQKLGLTVLGNYIVANKLDLTALNDAITEANAKVAAGFEQAKTTQEKWDALTKTLKKAQDFVKANQTNSSVQKQSEANQLTQDLMESLTDLDNSNSGKPVTPVTTDKTQLKAVLNQAKQELESSWQYQEDSYQDCQTAIKAAQKVLQNDEATQTQIDQATKDLKSSLQKLVKIWTVKNVDQVCYISYVPGYSVKVYDLPKGKFVNQMLKHGTSWHVSQIAENASGQKYYRLGKNQWIEGQYASDSPVSDFRISNFKAVGYINYIPNYKIKVWNEPMGKFTGKYLAHDSAWKIFKKAVNSKGQIFYNVGGNQWIDGQYVVFDHNQVYQNLSGIVTIKYVKGYGVNLWKDSNTNSGYYLGRKLNDGSKWKVFGKQNGFYKLGNNQWVQSIYTSYNAK